MRQPYPKESPRRYYWNGMRSVLQEPEPMWFKVFGAVWVFCFCAWIFFCLFSQ